MRQAVTYASLLALELMLASSDAVAEQRVRVDAGMTMSRVPSVDRNGTGFAVEIKGLANDSLAIGGRLEIAFMYGGHIGDDDQDLKFAMEEAALLKAEYHLMPGLVRPFISAAAGVYSVGSQSLEASPSTGRLEFRDGRFFGVAPQIGVDVGRVRLAATYNMIVGADLEVMHLGGATPSTEDLSQNYLSVELSFAFAAPRKPPPPMPAQPPPPTYPPAYPQPYAPPAYPPAAPAPAAPPPSP